MATVSAFSTSSTTTTLHSIPYRIPAISSLTLPIKALHFQAPGIVAGPEKHLTLKTNIKRVNENLTFRGIRRLKSAEEETQIPEELEQEEEEQQQEQEAEQPTVTVPVSPSDTLTMYFQADGTMNETSIPAVTKALEGTDGITDLKVQVVEGIASVELKKQTTVQATGVASGLVELIQGSGFKLQTLNLSFEDDEDLVAV